MNDQQSCLKFVKMKLDRSVNIFILIIQLWVRPRIFLENSITCSSCIQQKILLMKQAHRRWIGNKKARRGETFFTGRFKYRTQETSI